VPAVVLFDCCRLCGPCRRCHIAVIGVIAIVVVVVVVAVVIVAAAVVIAVIVVIVSAVVVVVAAAARHRRRYLLQSVRLALIVAEGRLHLLRGGAALDAAVTKAELALELGESRAIAQRASPTDLSF
jgi:hypothetical protein